MAYTNKVFIVIKSLFFPECNIDVLYCKLEIMYGLFQRQ